MSRWKRVNRGLILTGILLLAVLVQQSVLGAQRRQERPAIEETVRSVVALHQETRMLPEEVRSDNGVSDEELDDRMDVLEESVRELYLEDEGLVDGVLRLIRDGLAAQAAGQMVVTEYRKNIESFESFRFRGDRVHVTFETRTAVRVDQEEIGFVETVITDRVELRRVDGTWRVVTAELHDPVETGKWRDGSDVPVPVPAMRDTEARKESA